MNINNFTIKSQRASSRGLRMQICSKEKMGLSKIENKHVFKRHINFRLMKIVTPF